MAFDATVGGADANSYVTVAYADDYFTTRLNSSAWSSAVTATKQSALVTATETIEEKFSWRGVKATDTQALHWPASEAYDCNGDAIDDTDIPGAVKRAVCEQALYLLTFDATQTPVGIMQGISSASVGAVSAVFDSKMTPERMQSRVSLILRCYGEMIGGNGGNTIGSAEVIRG